MVAPSDLLAGRVLCRCGRYARRVKDHGAGEWSHDARCGGERAGAVETAAAPPAPVARAWSSAKPTDCAAGHRHPSKMEARVCERLTAECAASGARLYRQVRLPLLSLAAKDNGAAMYATIDFGIVVGGKLARLVDAKNTSNPRTSREWARGAAACESAWGIKVEEVEK